MLPTPCSCGVSSKQRAYVEMRQCSVQGVDSTKRASPKQDTSIHAQRKCCARGRKARPGRPAEGETWSFSDMGHVDYDQVRQSHSKHADSVDQLRCSSGYVRSCRAKPLVCSADDRHHGRTVVSLVSLLETSEHRHNHASLAASSSSQVNPVSNLP